MKYLLMVFMAFMLSACGNDTLNRSDYLPYMVTKVGNQAEFTYVGPDDAVSKASEVITVGYDQHKRSNCLLRTSRSGVDPEGSKLKLCQYTSNVVLGNVVRLHYKNVGIDGVYKAAYINSTKSGNVDTERLLAAAQLAANNSNVGLISTRIDGLGELIKVVDTKVDANMGMTVAAVKAVNAKTDANGDQIQLVMNDVSANTSTIKNANREYEANKKKSTKLKPKHVEQTITIKSSDANPFGFIK